MTRNAMNPRRMVRRLSACLCVLLCAAAAFAGAGEWPAYKHDLQRTSATDDSPTFPMRLAWHYVAPQPPNPAWPDTYKLVNRTDFDYAPHPVIAQGVVCVASNSDDAVRAFDAATGAEKWHYITGGPVRIAPQIDSGKVYFGSDDGYAYCVDLNTGKLVWRFGAAPRDERLAGNHRMISRWPLRTGVVVENRVAYFVAGMWNTEGVFAYALDADTGKVIWCNDLLGFIAVSIVDFPSDGDPRKEQVGGHNGEFAANGAIGMNPQGPMLVGGDLLLVPNGNSGPTFLDKRTGKTASPTSNTLPAGTGGTWLTIDGETLFAFSKHRPNVLMIAPRALAGGAVKKAWTSSSNPPVPQITIDTPPDKLTNAIQARGKVSAVVRRGKLLARAAFGLALLGDTLIVGEENAVVAQDPDSEREIWRAPVNGEAREIAFADGRLFVGTSTGDIYCFETAPKGSERTPTIARPAAGAAPIESTPAVTRAVGQLRQAGMDRGFALVIGDTDTKFASALAASTQLKTIVPITDPAAVAALRDSLLTKTTLHGSRVQIAEVTRIEQLPFTQYFANAVVVAGPLPASANLTAFAKELLRVLRPCGGVMMFPGLKPAEADSLAKACGSASTEIEVRNTPEGLLVIRGKLPGASDWNVSGGDKRVKWPLRPLWYGGPSTAQTQGGPGPLVAAGRYIIGGSNTLTVVDAYNGEIHWSRQVPRTSPNELMIEGVIYPVDEQQKFGRFDVSSGCIANDNFIFLNLSKAYFEGYQDELAKLAGEEVQGRSRREGVVQIDARTGEQVRIAGPFNPVPPILLKGAKQWTIEVDAKRTGTITMEAVEKGLSLTLTTKDTLVSKLDGFELFFDFRPSEARYGLYERGTFCERVVVAQDKSTPARLVRGNGPAHPEMQIAGTREPGGTKTTLLIPWSELEKIVGVKPTSFGFAATFNSHDGGKGEPIVRRHLFCDWCADGINNGWATVVIGGDAKPTDGLKPPSVLVESVKEPAGVARGIGGDVATPMREALRVHPLTGDLGPKMFRVGGCGGLAQASVLRSGSQSIYDFEDDSGMRPIGGLKVRCSTAEIAALGLLMFSEELGHCVCNYPVRTTLALAPAERRLNEDWAFYFDRPADTYLRLAAINFGVPGDRRAEDGTLWLGFPRLPGDKSRAFPRPAASNTSVGANGVWLRVMAASLQVPLDVKFFGGPSAYTPREDTSAIYGWMNTWAPGRNRKEFGPYRANADRVEVQGTDKPWLYASGLRGLQTAKLNLTYLKPIITQAVDKPPVVDQKLSAPEWKTPPQARLPFTGTDVFVRHDQENLYIAARRPSVIDRLGFTSGWTKSTKGEDAPVWQDDSFEVFLANGDGSRVAHVGVSASGARFDALSSDGKNEDAAWNGEWKGVALAEQSPRAVKPGDASKNPVPSTEAMVKVNPKEKKKSDAADETVGDALDMDVTGRKEDPAANESPLVFEIVVPWKTLESVGIMRDTLGMNVQMNQRDTSGEPEVAPGVPQVGRQIPAAGEALSYLGIEGRQRCRNFAHVGLGKEPGTPPRSFLVKLHFAELDDAKPGQRVFDVKLQDKLVLKDFDIVKEAGGPRRALVKEIAHIPASDALTLELVPHAEKLQADNAPTICAMEVYDESHDLRGVAK